MILYVTSFRVSCKFETPDVWYTRVNYINFNNTQTLNKLIKAVKASYIHVCNTSPQDASLCCNSCNNRRVCNNAARSGVGERSRCRANRNGEQLAERRTDRANKRYLLQFRHIEKAFWEHLCNVQRAMHFTVVVQGVVSSPKKFSLQYPDIIIDYYKSVTLQANPLYILNLQKIYIM